MTGLLAAALAAAALATSAPAGGKLTVRSTDLKDGGQVAAEQVSNVPGCGGRNVSPQLSWRGAPEGTRSFVVTVYDPDAPAGSGSWHWVVYDIPARTTALPKGAGFGQPGLPAGAKQGRTDFGARGYGGPCPPPGKPHRYVFTVYALKVDRLEVPADASPAFIGVMARAKKLASASLTATYGRKK